MASEFVERLASTEMPCVIVSGYGEDALPEFVKGVRRLEKPASATSVLESLEDELARTR